MSSMENGKGNRSECVCVQWGVTCGQQGCRVGLTEKVTFK